MAGNIADLIENYILHELADKGENKVELRRTDIAEAISCAPSQISYVLNTRFTQDKGFAVESRRGLGGFIRIVRMPIENLVYQDMMDKVTEETSIQTVESMAQYLMQHGMTTARETAIFLQAVGVAYKKLEPADRVAFIRSLLLTLERV
ncbi:transcriptional regulator CtsR [Selenomonas sp. TAMA-11512]|uniref:CtsR family transcriptional regulator n=1 Tax=Selenomonas sp. TAMA-11512 TaxID=3095337 RepID=UPI003092BBFA|nr:transcriptional regulator CtsR [Selenomonas sp. TAMA-11512]